MKMTGLAKTTAMFFAVLATCSLANAQDGLAGELEDLLGIGDAQPAEGAAEAKVEEVAEKAEAAVEAVEEKAEEAAPAAEAAEAKAEEVVEKVEAAAEAVEEKVEEAAPAAEAKAEEVAEKVEAAAEAVEEKVEEAAPAAEEKVAEKLDDLLAPAGDAPVKVEEAAPVAKVEEVAEEAEVAEVAEPVEAPVAEAVPAVEAAAPAEQPEVAAVPEIELPDDLKAEISEVETLERMRRKALEEHGNASLAKAREEMKDGNYAEAQRLYEEAVKFITKRPGNEKNIDEAEQGVAESIYRQANVLWKKGVLDEAIKMARQAREKNHPKANQLISDIQAEIDNPPKPPRPKEAKRWNEKSFKENAEEIKHRLGKAREYYITGEYDLARSELEIILKNNPYNQDAIDMLRRVAERDYDFASDEFLTTRSGMIQDVRAKWTPRRYAIDIADLGESKGAHDTMGVVDSNTGKTPSEMTADKMSAIVIPEINFRAANINDVISFFEDASREFDDPEIPPEKRGVNLILKLANNAPAQEQIADDNPFAQADASASAGGIPPVSFNARFMSLYEALKIICEISGLKFIIRGNIVMIMPVDVPDVEMVNRTYTVLPSIEERASGISQAITTSKGGDNNGFGVDPADMDSGSGSVDWKQLFSDMGVKWPTGSTITYLPSINKIRVLNTPENLVEFEKALQELNVTPRQVEIEARFVEVGQTDLESLGFEWLLTDDWEIANKKGDSYQRIKMSAGSGTTGLRYFSDESAAATGMEMVNDKVATVASVLTNPELSFVLHALSQRANTDLLSAPKVVTMNGQEAIIKVVTEYIYPTEYELEEYDSSGDSDNVQNVYPAVQPTEFDMREVGVVLQVIPEVSEDGEMIYLQLNPQIISEPEWEDYGFEYPKGVIDANGDMETYHIAMRQPLFKVRSINTKIAIYNGATVVMGGMITEERLEVEDKVPFLGDIPLLGRLFRSKYEQSDKRNLLIFVTARMVDPAGRTVKSENAGGISSDSTL